MSDVRFGQCLDESAQFIATLSRNLNVKLDEVAMHIFFKKNSVLLFNRSRLDLLDGDFIRFDALFEGNGEKKNWPSEKALFLKRNCKVMLVWNKSDELKKRKHGHFQGSTGRQDAYRLRKCWLCPDLKGDWNWRNRQGEGIGSVTQFPIILAYAVTCHKSQALQLVLHSPKEFVPGLVYIAISRIRTQETFQVLGFKRSQVIPADPEVTAQCNKSTGNCDPNLCCCRRKAVVNKAFFDVHDDV